MDRLPGPQNRAYRTLPESPVCRGPKQRKAPQRPYNEVLAIAGNPSPVWSSAAGSSAVPGVVPGGIGRPLSQWRAGHSWNPPERG
jgi:hypothetical protein